MTTYTRAQLVTEAARNLMLMGDGESLDDEYEDYIDLKYDALISQLASDEIVEIDDDAEIPAEYFTALGALLANECAQKFGVQYSEEKRRVFEARLRKSAAASPTGETLKTVYY